MAADVVQSPAVNLALPVHRHVQLRPATPRVGAAWSVHPLELGDPGASRLGVIKGCWAQDRTAGRTSSEKVTDTHDNDELARRLWSVLT